MLNPPFRPYFQGNVVFLDHSPFRKIPGMSGQSFNADFAHVDSLSGFTRIFVLRENINPTRMVILSPKELAVRFHHSVDHERPCWDRESQHSKIHHFV